MPAKKTPLRVPVSFSGGILHDTDYGRGADTLEEMLADRAEAERKLGHARWAASYYWDEVEPFEASVKVTGHQRHRTAAYFTFVDRQGHQFTMFLVDAAEFFGSANLTDGWSEVCTFEPCKRGTAYGIRRVKS